MSGQQSMFADPEHRPPGQRMYNTDSQEQSWSESEEVPPMYAEEFHQAQRGGAKIQPEQPKKRNRLLAIVPLILLAVLLAGGFGLARTSFLSSQSSQTTQVVYNSQGFISPAHVIIQDASGDVHVHSSSQNNILVMSTNGTDKNRVRYRQEGDTMVIAVDGSGSLFAGPTINLDVSLPQSSSVAVESHSGSVDLADMSGYVQVQTDSGAIHAQDLSGAVGLRTTSGDIEVQGLNGQTALQTNSGDITVDQANLNGESLISTFSGSITYNGSLAAGSPYRFESRSGDVRLNLPSSSSLVAETHTSSGNVDNDFDNMPGAGSSPAYVSIITTSGDIAIKQAS
ncbi:MAG TPA: DUF4097 family beta strand repeat-containing protein [Ktedonobacteraceae bacterium]|jgi:DUF4097 and DUF4098 domain-containing protein YvlB|nr:DUF4097 family beta strand repeat-containing protein [Ktedonobacteraceae bacterium]